MANVIADVLDALPARLRTFRERGNRTLAEVAAATGISTSTLSRLESGSRRATLALLLPLSRVYEVPLDELVGAPEVGDPRIHPRPVRRSGGGVILPLNRQSRDLVAFKVVLPGAKPGDVIEQRVHGGFDWLFVLSGSLRLKLGDEESVLHAGQSTDFDTRRPHGFASASPEPVEVLSLVSPQGERIHYRPT
jgi:transcriptional regulator with XRE-family HTH domain